ncbi:MAG: amiloride-sensitive sodium channel family protein [Ignavibacteria bacterium]|nr:amiloride-sensitive sodium channel family protein [Ignavibacteria bacterium]
MIFIIEAYGVVAVVHDNTQLPLIEKVGITLAPGRKHKLGYRKKSTYFLSPPYTKCTSKISFAMQTMFDNYNDADYRYSEPLCYQLCAQVYA